MSTAIFYRTALDRKLSDRTKGLFEILLESNEHIERITEYVFGKVGGSDDLDDADSTEANEPERRRRQEVREEKQRLEGAVKTYVTLMSSERMLVETALESEKTALGHEREMYESGDPDELRLMRGAIHLREGNIRYLTTFTANMNFRPKQGL